MNLLSELKRRGIWRVAIAYLAAAWFLIEVADTIFPRIGFGDVAVTNVILVLMIGFVPILVLAWFFEWTPDGIKRDADVDSTGPASPQRSKTLDRFIVAMLVLAVGLLAFDKLILDPARDTIEIEAATKKGYEEAVLGSYGDKSIAVLAFSDMSPERDQEYFSDGIAEEILNVLTTVRKLRVISRSSAFSFKGSKATIPEIGEKLNVSYILEGSVRKSGDKMRITAQLIDAKTDTHIWSHAYDSTLDDVFEVQGEISKNIVEELRLTFRDDFRSSKRTDPKAYDKYLRARFLVHTGDEKQLREAQKLLNEILADHPDYTPALSELSRVYFRIPKSEGMSDEENIAEIRALGERVIAIDPNSISALIWQGWFADDWDADYQAAASHYEKALRIDPGNVNLLRVVMVLLNQIERSDDAIAVGHYLASRDPNCDSCANNLAYAYRASGQPEEAARTMEKILLWHPPTQGFYWSIGVGWLVAGYPEKALVKFEQEIFEGNREMGAIMALHDLNRMEAFEDRFAELRGADVISAEGIARIYAWTGNNDKAFEWLEKMVEEGGPGKLRNIDTDLYEKIKSDPRWRALRDKHGYYDQPIGDIKFDFTLPGMDPLGST